MIWFENEKMISGIRYQLGPTQVVISRLNIKVRHVYQGEFFRLLIHPFVHLSLNYLFLLVIDRLLQFVSIWPCSSYSPLFLIPKVCHRLRQIYPFISFLLPTV